MSNGRLLFTTRELASEMKKMEEYSGAQFYDTSSRGRYRIFSPFTVWQETIPVPGQPLQSHSVEGIWQGLKLINDKCDFSQFGPQRAKKRKYEPYSETQFLYGETPIPLIEARHKIYVPSYRYMFENLVPKTAIERILKKRAEGIDQYFYDVDTNPNINDDASAYAHASLLVDLLENCN